MIEVWLAHEALAIPQFFFLSESLVSWLWNKLFLDNPLYNSTQLLQSGLSCEDSSGNRLYHWGTYSFYYQPDAFYD